MAYGLRFCLVCSLTLITCSVSNTVFENEHVDENQEDGKLYVDQLDPIVSDFGNGSSIRHERSLPANESRGSFNAVVSKDTNFVSRSNSSKTEADNTCHVGSVGNAGKEVQAWIIEKVDKLLDQVFEIVKTNRHGENCTYEVDLFYNATNSPKVEVSKWLMDLEDFRNMLTDDAYIAINYKLFVWTMFTSLRNSLNAVEDYKKNKVILEICDPTRLLKCFNDSKCGCVTNDNPFSPSNKLNTLYEPELDLCLLYEGNDCPIHPTTLLCENKTNCLTKVQLQPCTIEHLRDEVFTDSTFKQDKKSGQFNNPGFALVFNNSELEMNDDNQTRTKVKEDKGRRLVRPKRDTSAENLTESDTKVERFSMSSRVTPNFHCACYGAYEGGNAVGLFDFKSSYLTISLLVLLTLI